VVVVVEVLDDDVVVVAAARAGVVGFPGSISSTTSRATTPPARIAGGEGRVTGSRERPSPHHQHA
jgi:hypothetical protein